MKIDNDDINPSTDGSVHRAFKEYRDLIDS